MQFDFKFNPGKGEASKGEIVSMLGSFWQKIYKVIFFVLLVGAVVFGWYVWQENLSGKGWSMEKKQQYLDAQNNGVVFKEKDFKKALSDVEARKKNDADIKQQSRDIFKSY